MAKMKSYPSFDEFLADKPPRNAALIRALRAFVRETEPDLVEAVKWSNGCWLVEGAPVAYVYSDVDHVQFGFIRGSSLKDPRGLLQGNGAYVRHVKVREPEDIDRKAFSALLLQAVKLGGVHRGSARAPKSEKKTTGTTRKPTPRAKPEGRKPRAARTSSARKLTSRSK